MTKQMKEFADSLRAMRDQEDAEIGKLEAQIAHHRDLQKRMTKAIEALDPREAAAKESGQKRTMPSPAELQRRLDIVHDCIAENDGATVKDVMAATELTRAQAQSAIDVLRSNEKVRKAGVGGPQGNANVYKLMITNPEVAHGV